MHPRPPDREVVVRDAVAWATGPPVVVDGRLAPGERGRAAQACIAEVMGIELAGRAAGRRWRLRRGPAHLCHRAASLLVVLHLDLVVPGGQRANSGVGGRGLALPGVDDEGAVDPHPDPVVGGGCEGVLTGVEAVRSDPPGREVVVRDPVAGATGPPVVVDGRLAPGERRRAAQCGVAEVVSIELTDRAARGWGWRRGRWRFGPAPAHLCPGLVGLLVVLHFDLVVPGGQRADG